MNYTTLDFNQLISQNKYVNRIYIFHCASNIRQRCFLYRIIDFLFCIITITAWHTVHTFSNTLSLLRFYLLCSIPIYTDGVIHTFTATNCEDRQTFPNPLYAPSPLPHISLCYLIFIYSNIRRGPFPRVRNVDVHGATPRRDIRRIDGILHFFPWTWAYGHVDAFHPFRSAINTRCNILLVRNKVRGVKYKTVIAKPLVVRSQNRYFSFIYSIISLFIFCLFNTCRLSL